MTKEMKIVIFSLVLLLTVGFATVVSDVLINGNSTVAYDANNFQVLFTNANIEGSGAATIIEDGNAISYTPSTLNNTNDTATVTYNIANNSSLYDANVNLVMKVYDENDVEVDPSGIFNIEQIEGSSEDIVAKTLEEGKFKITVVGDLGEHSYRFVLTKELEAVERTSIAEGDVIPPGIEITFDPNGGKTLTVEKKNVMYNSTYGTLPETTALGQAFEGWYTEPEGGTKVTSDTVITNAADHTLYAHYQDPVATCDGYGYMTLQKAINAGYTDGTISLVELLQDTSEPITIDASKKINMDLNNHSVTSPREGYYGFSNRGELSIVDGSISSVAASIYNYNKITMNNVNVSAPNVAIKNSTGATLNVTGGTITSSGYYGLNNFGTAVINDSTITATGTSASNAIAVYQDATGSIELTNTTLSSDHSYTMAILNGATASITGGSLSNTSTNEFGLITNSGILNLNSGTYTNNQTTRASIYNNASGTINVYGGSYSSTSTMFNNQGTLNMNEDVEILNHTKSVISNSGTTTVNGGHYSSSVNVFSCSAGTFTINDGTIEGLATNYPTVVNNASSTCNIVINGGSFSSPGTYVLWNRKSNMTINGGTFHTLNNYVVNVASGANMSITGGEFSNSESTTAKSILYVEGTATVSGGTFNQTTNTQVIYVIKSGTLYVEEGANIDTSTSNAIVSRGDVIVNGGSISSSAASYPTIILSTPASGQEPGSLTINGGTITGDSNAIWFRTGTSNVHGGTLTTTGEKSNIIDIDSGATVNIDGGTFNQADNSGSLVNLEGTATISGGTFNQIANSPVIYVDKLGTLCVEEGTNIDASTSNAIVSRGDVIVNGGSILSSAASSPAISLTTPASDQEPGLLTINGGTITGVSNAIWVRAGTSNIHGGILTTTGENYTIDIDFGATVNIDGGTFNQADNSSYLINIDGTGTISGGTFNQSAVISILRVTDGGNLTIEDGVTFEGELSNVVTNFGTLTINGGILNAYSSTYPCVVQQATGSTTINGGTIYSEQSSAIWAKGTVTINNGDISTDKAAGISQSENTTVTITSGTIYSSNNHAIKTEGGTINISGGTFTSSSNNALYLLNSPTSNISGGEFTTNSKNSIYVSGSTIDFTGGTVTSYSGGALSLDNNAHATINDGIFKSTTNIGVVMNGGAEATILGGTIHSDDGNAIQMSAGSQATVNGGEITSNNLNSVFVAEESTINIHGGLIQSDSSNGNNNNALYVESSTANIYDGTIYASKGVALASVEGTINVSGGTIYNNSNQPSIHLEKAAITITGGNIYSDSSRGYALYTDKDSTATISGGTLSNGDKDVYDDAISYVIYSYGTLVVNDGTTIIGNNTGALIYSLGTTTINGGSFETDIASNLFDVRKGDFTIPEPLNIVAYSGVLIAYGGNVIINGGSYSNITKASGVGNASLFKFVNTGTTAELNNVTATTEYTYLLYGSYNNVININGGLFTATDDAIVVDLGRENEPTSTVNIKGATIKSTKSAIRSSGTINVDESTELIGTTTDNTGYLVLNEKEGTFNSINANYLGNSYTYIYNKGTLNIHKDTNMEHVPRMAIMNSSTGTANIVGGYYHLDSNDISSSYLISNSGNMEISDGTFIVEDRPLVNNSSNATLNITGGAFEEKNKYNLLSSYGYVHISGDPVFTQSSTTGAYVIDMHDGNVEIEGGTYNSTSKMFNSYEGTFNITGNINIDNINANVINVGARATLNVSAGTYRAVGADHYVISTGISHDSSGNYYKSEVNISGGTFISEDYRVLSSYGNTTITGGSFVSGSTSTQNTIYNRGSLSISGDVSVTNNGTGGLIYNDNGASNSDGYIPELTLSGGTYTGHAKYITNYGTLVINNLTVNNIASTFLINHGNATINGGTYSNEGANIQLIEETSGSLHLNDGTYRSSSSVVYQTLSGSTYIDTGTYYSTGGKVFHNQGYLNIANAHIENLEGTTNNGYLLYLIDNSETIVSNSEFYAHGPTYAVLMDGQPTLNTDSAYFKAENGYAMYLLDGTLTFDNSVVESTNNTAALFQDGTYNLNSGAFRGHSDYYDLYKTPSGSATINLNHEVIVTKKNW